MKNLIRYKKLQNNKKLFKLKNLNKIDKEQIKRLEIFI